MASIIDVISFEINRTIRKKNFWIATLAPLIIILAVLTIEYISSNQASKSSQSQAADYLNTAKIGVFDQSGLIETNLLRSSNITIESSQAQGISQVKNGQLDAFFYYPSEVDKTGIDIYAQDKGLTFSSADDAAASQLLKTSALTHLNNLRVNPQAVQVLNQAPSTNDTTYKNGQETNGLASIIAPGFVMIVFLALMVLLVYTMVSSTTEEKENRVAEILLTSIKTRTVILGKIWSIFVVAVVQIAVIVLPLLIIYPFVKNHIHLPGGVSLSQVPLNVEPITIAILFLIGGLIMFTGFLVGLGAMFPSATEANRYAGIGMIWAYIPIYTIALIIQNPDALPVKIFTYFPLTAPTTVMLRNAAGTISFSQALIPLLIVIISDVLALGFAVRAFRSGALEYGRRISFKELWR